MVATLALTVEQATHPVDWTFRGPLLVSPVVASDDQNLWVELRPGYRHFFPTVIVPSVGEYRSFNPWGWPSNILFLHLSNRRLADTTRRRLWAHGILTDKP